MGNNLCWETLSVEKICRWTSSNVTVYIVAGEQLPAGGIDQTTGGGYDVVEIVKRSSDDCQVTEDNEWRKKDVSYFKRVYSH